MRELKMQKVYLAPEEEAALRSRAEEEGVSVSGLLRKSVGLPPLGRGGARDGAGRPPAKKARKAK